MNHGKIKSNAVISSNSLMIGVIKTSFVVEFSRETLFSLPKSAKIIQIKLKHQQEKVFGMLREQKASIYGLNRMKCWGILGRVFHSNVRILPRLKIFQIMVRIDGWTFMLKTILITIILVNAYDIDSSGFKGQRNIPKLKNQNFTDLNEGRDQESWFLIDVTFYGYYDVGVEKFWWQLKHVSDGFSHFGHQHRLSFCMVTNIENQSPASTNRHQHHCCHFVLIDLKDDFNVGECNFLKLDEYLIIAYIDTDEFEIKVELGQPDDVRSVWDL